MPGGLVSKAVATASIAAVVQVAEEVPLPVVPQPEGQDPAARLDLEVGRRDDLAGRPWNGTQRPDDCFGGLRSFPGR